jgi:DNA-binding winged helix-turn-helix (wHTH) protein
VVLAFGPFELDEELFVLRRAGIPVEVQPKVLGLLLFLIRARERVVSKQELLDGLWPDVTVGDGALMRAVSAARSAIGDGGETQHAILTVPRRGYRFVATVEERVAEPAAEQAAHPFVGRADALARLRTAWERASSGAGRVALLSGEPGIGKTRTAG